MKKLNLLKPLFITFLIIVPLKMMAQYPFEATKRSAIFTNGVSNLVSYIDLGNIQFWGFLEISITDAYSQTVTSGLYRKVYSIGTTASTFSSNTSEVTSIIGPVSNQWKLGEFERDPVNNRLWVPIYHLTSLGNRVTVHIKGVSVFPVSTDIFTITNPEVITNTQTRDYNYVRGKLAIGTSKSDSDAQLTVAGNINAREMKVKIDAGADFVFNELYDLPSLKNVESYVKTYGHLRDISSAKEMKANGLKVGDFQIKLLQKIEELTLYLIEQNKKIENLTGTVQMLQKVSSDKKLAETNSASKTDPQ